EVRSIASSVSPCIDLAGYRHSDSTVPIRVMGSPSSRFGRGPARSPAGRCSWCQALTAQTRDEELDQATGVVAGPVRTCAEVADAVHQLEGIHISADLARRNRRVEQLRAARHEAVEEVGVQGL